MRATASSGKCEWPPPAARRSGCGEKLPSSGCPTLGHFSQQPTNFFLHLRHAGALGDHRCVRNQHQVPAFRQLTGSGQRTHCLTHQPARPIALHRAADLLRRHVPNARRRMQKGARSVQGTQPATPTRAFLANALEIGCPQQSYLLPSVPRLLRAGE